MSEIQLIRLGVNIDHVATLRQTRKTLYPDPLQAALLVEQAGADGITAHLREDRRHIQDRDIELLRERVQTRLNLEMAVTEEMIEIATRIKPQAVCLVPEKRQELTTEGGLDVVAHSDAVKSACDRLAEAGCEVSLFIDPEPKQIDAVLNTSAPVIELHTGCYADAANDVEQKKELARLRAAASYAHQAGLQVNGGHGIQFHNVQPICRIPEIVELNIGHSIIARAVFTGLQAAVQNMKQLISEGRGGITG
ncbi:MAG: pyridoxine 5'-phosphate synthase [Gammaproteobacteria bacterium]|nr:pyridoxine 5'-phosphate synthase [Gammaproteobacteria bacterium]